jgi:ribosomal protein S12 methylthiotransferase accessory factor
MQRMSSSLREMPLELTLTRAKAAAKELGISRVTDTTRLDRIGIPVFASIRPDACKGSLCVNAGKGLRIEEARVGAYMEAIEFAIAESRRRTIEVFALTPRRVACQHGAQFRFVDLCPRLGHAIDPDGQLDCVTAADLVTGEPLYVPAELAFSPFTENTGQCLFGSTTNGLCSGNSVDEAFLHGLAEVMERDVQSFNLVRDTSLWVDFDVHSEPVEELLHLIDKANLQVAVRYTSNVFGMPYFQAYILEPDPEAPIAISHGSGLHLIREVAVVRALTEAAQGRLSYIHGGRDDLVDRFRFFQSQQPNVECREAQRLRVRVRDQSNRIRYSRTADHSLRIARIPDGISILLGSLQAAGIDQVLHVVLSTPGSELSVVKVIVPKLELFDSHLRRVGPRLYAYFTQGQVTHGNPEPSTLRGTHTVGS